MFTEKDLMQIKQHGLTAEKVVEQIDNFKRGFGFLPIEKAATGGEGVTIFDHNTVMHYKKLYADNAHKSRIMKFVPSSGAATRMFKGLFEYVDGGDMNADTKEVVSEVRRFAFYDKVRDNMDANDPKSIVQAVLNYGAELPKALIIFHKYADELRTAMDEHLVEGALYAASNGEVRIHFTISAEHLDGFERQLAQVQQEYEERYGVRYDVTFSQQKNSTDAIAVTLDNEPFRDDDGTLFFRPAGHGALLENLNSIDADFIFIKNIDNVTPDHLKEDTVTYNMAAAGVLMELQEAIFEHIKALDTEVNGDVLREIEEFISKRLSCRLPDNFDALDYSERVQFLLALLNRPIRVCGMVRNEGEQGGGPFWVRNANGTVSLQIAEPSQIAPRQTHLLSEGTHFNPVMLVCGVKDHKGQRFDLQQFTDPATGFISEKSKSGRPLKAQELPGLWNGAMANWHTIFIEVPVSTFCPVKEVKDLLRAQHQ